MNARLAEFDVCDLTTIGRKSGRERTVEIWFGMKDSTVYLLSGGGLTIQYASLASSVVAIEPDPANVALARESAAATGITNSSFKVGTAERVRMGGGAFDIALFSWSL